MWHHEVAHLGGERMFERMAEVIPLVSRAALAGRIALARSLLDHRPWCPDCARTARLVDAALAGASIEDLTRKDSTSGTG